jgi:hypothetical protein
LKCRQCEDRMLLTYQIGECSAGREEGKKKKSARASERAKLS